MQIHSFQRNRQIVRIKLLRTITILHSFQRGKHTDDFYLYLASIKELGTNDIYQKQFNMTTDALLSFYAR